MTGLDRVRSLLQDETPAPERDLWESAEGGPEEGSGRGLERAAALTEAAWSGVARSVSDSPVPDSTVSHRPPALDRRVPATRSPESLRAWEALPLVAPDPRHLARGRVVTHAEPGAPASPLAAPFDRLRTRLTQRLQEQGWLRLGITAPGPGCGTSTLCLNLGFSLARQAGARALLIEADLAGRGSGLAGLLGLAPARRDIGAVLAGRALIAEAALRPAPGLAVALAAGGTAQPSELLQAPATAEALARIETLLSPTILLVDLPPLLVGDAGLSLLPQLDAVLIVAAAGQSSLREIDLAEREAATQTEVLGVVLNRCADPGEGQGYGPRFGRGFPWGLGRRR